MKQLKVSELIDILNKQLECHVSSWGYCAEFRAAPYCIQKAARAVVSEFSVRTSGTPWEIYKAAANYARSTGN